MSEERDKITASRNPSSLEVFGPSQKVAQAIGAWNGQEVVERVRQSEHATEADIIKFAETFLDGGYREREEGKSFSRLFEAMLREGPGIIDKQLEAVEHERKRRQEELANKRKNIDVAPSIRDFEWILEAFGLGSFGDDDPFDDESTASRKLWSTQKEKGRTKGYATWNPQKKTEIILAQIDEILRQYRTQLPLTGRQIFYRLVGKYGHPKTESFANSVGEILVRARRSRRINFDDIRDDGASVMDYTHYADENAFYKHIGEDGNNYKRDKLQRQKKDIRVYCEAAGMMPQLRTVCEPFSVKVYSCSGFDSLTAKYDLASDIASASTYKGRNTVILHLGDHDPSGETIFDAISEDVYAFLEVDIPHKDPTEVAIFERVALTTEQIRRYDLPTDPFKQSSHSHNWPPHKRACQLEALEPDVLADALREAIEKHFDMEILKEDIRAEEEERRRITKALTAPKS